MVNIENLFPQKYDFKCKKSSFVSQSRIVNSFAIYLFLRKLSMSDLILKPRKNVLREVYYWGLSNVKDRGLFEAIRRRDVQQLLRTLIMGQLFSWKQFKNLRTPVTKKMWILDSSKIMFVVQKLKIQLVRSKIQMAEFFYQTMQTQKHRFKLVTNTLGLFEIEMHLPNTLNSHS